MMLGALKQLLFGSQLAQRDEDTSEKITGLERLLGPRYDDDESAIGLTHLCYFTQCVSGTALATTSLIEPPHLHVKQRRRAIPYELVAFTRHSLAHLDTDDKGAAFQEMNARITYLLDTVARYSTVDTLKPGSSCELPTRKGEKAGSLVFLEFMRDNERLSVAGETYTLLLCIEVFAQEMAYARTHGVGALVEQLKEAGYYPYSDLDRASVV